MVKKKVVAKKDKAENKDIKKRVRKVAQASKKENKRVKKQRKEEAAKQLVLIEEAKAEFLENTEAIYDRGRRGLRRFMHRQNIEQNLLVAFVINFFFSVLEFFGGILSGSVSIMADAVHDFGDAISIGFSYFCERKSKRSADKTYTFGYSRYSVLGAFISTTVLVVGSCLMVYEALVRFTVPSEVKAGWMIAFAIFGIVVNGFATFKTSGDKKHLNQRAVNLHLLEDVVCWVIVLVGALVISWTGWTWIDPVMSICISVALIGAALENYRKILDLFLEKVPAGTSVDMVRYVVMSIPHVKNAHHIHVWSMNEDDFYATMHVVVDGAVIDGILLENSVESPQNIKAEIRKQLAQAGIKHVTIELESEVENCNDKKC